MRKYWAIFKISWENAVEYRAEFLGHMMLGLVSLLVMYFIWSAVFVNRESFGNYTFTSMMTYLLMVQFVHFVKRSGSLKMIANEIKEGGISAYLIKPVSYLRWWLAVFLADRSFESILRILMFLVFLLFFPHVFEFLGIGRLLVFLVVLIFSLFLNFLVHIFINILAFFVTDVRLFRSSFIMLADFLAGSLVPLDLLPGVLKNIALCFPFQFWIYFPIKLYQGQLSSEDLIWSFLLFFFWTFLIFLGVKSLWQKGIKNYEAIGQ